MIIFYVFFYNFSQIAIYILFYAIATGIFDYHSYIKDIFIFVLPNSEGKNILLLKESNYKYKNMLINKVKLFQRLSFFQFVIIVLIFNIVTISLGICSIKLNLSLVIWSCIIFYFSPWLHIYGEVYNTDFYFTNYQEIQEKSMLKRFYSKFYKIPRKLFDFMYGFIIFISFLDLDTILIFVLSNTFYLLLFAYIIFVNINKGENFFYGKNLF
ncbi:hypothetical protein SAMN03080614_10142 [Anaerobranca gottschalkii DSM 13577]|uniref:Uncharacterized protein n=1 Tax=Anaerobranca gottschalkii DSM 13577 TaxID=1120990 RepID=A0A1H9ZVS7_9FIRM|nr:hypothetical protein SAMN03080614_10142 [Anaerobranca gottschalkii DSM 13577]